jgi:hypothetical protein
VLTLKRAAAALDLMKSVVVSVARDGMKSVAVCWAVSGWFVLMAESNSLAMEACCHLMFR